MKGIILAAGRGSRMGSATDKMPKCKTEFRGKPLLHWQLQALEEGGVGELAIVRGYLAETFRESVRYFENLRWADSNMVVSALSANEWLESDTCILSYSDIIYSSDVVKRVSECSAEIVISYDPNWLSLWQERFENPLDDAETFLLNDEGYLREIGNRTDDIENIQGQFMGLIKTTPKGWRDMARYLASCSSGDVDRMDMTSLLARLIAEGVKIAAVPIIDPWYEFDSLSDLQLYERQDAANV